MEKLDKKFAIIFIILLPFFIVVLLDLTPYSKITKNLWERINIPQNSIKSEMWIAKAKTLLRMQPWQASVWLRVAEQQYNLGNLDDSLNSIENAQALKPLSVEQSIWLGQIYWDTNQSDKAYATWQSVTNASKISIEELQKLVQIQQLRNDWYGAYLTLLRWYEVDPSDKAIIRPLTFSQILFDPDNAITTIKNSYNVNLQPLIPEIELILKEENPVYQVILSGNLLASIEEWGYAKAAFTYATRLDPQYAEAWALYGNAINQTGGDGYSALNKALQLSPQSSMVNALVASYWRMQNDYSKSIEIYKNLAKQEPENVLWQLEMANTYVQLGDLDKAFQAYTMTTKMEPGNSSNWVRLARFSGEFRVNIQEYGLPAARQAILLDEKNWEAHDTLGWLYLILEDYSSAERFLMSAYKYSPEEALVNLHLGQLFYLLKNPELSTFFLKRSIEFSSDDQITRLAEKFLNP